MCATLLKFRYNGSMRRKATKPRKPTLSPTKISTYLACPVMYKYTYIDRISRFYYRPKAYHSFGASLHRTLEEFHKAGGAELQSPEQLVEKLHSTWTSLGYTSAEESETRLEEASQLLEQYHTEYHIPGVTTLFTEKQLKCDLGEFSLIGRLDRLDEYTDKSLEIIDYKSGRLSVQEEEVKNDLAMRIYSYLTRCQYPNRRISATIYCLRSGNKATVEFTDEDAAEIEDGVRTVAEKILQIDEDSVIEPVWLPYVCPKCDYLRLCARRMRWDVNQIISDYAE